MDPLTLGLLTIFGWLMLWQLKHFAADYLFQTPYMLGKFKESGWVKPLSAHCGVHAVFTLIILLPLLLPAWLLFLLVLFDFVVHFTMDRVKASPKLLGRYSIKEREFWWALGFDQMIHHMTHYIIMIVAAFWYITNIPGVTQ